MLNYIAFHVHFSLLGTSSTSPLHTPGLFAVSKYITPVSGFLLPHQQIFLPYSVPGIVLQKLWHFPSTLPQYLYVRPGAASHLGVNNWIVSAVFFSPHSQPHRWGGDWGHFFQQLNIILLHEMKV